MSSQFVDLMKKVSAKTKIMTALKTIRDKRFMGGEETASFFGDSMSVPFEKKAEIAYIARDLLLKSYQRGQIKGHEIGHTQNACVR
jgi:hypothetical protein